MGPFYCPADHGIYLDTSFYDLMDKQMGAGGDFARYYVMAHEYGHHVQNLTGIAKQIRSAQQQNPGRANALQVAMELQADCYAGVWAGKNRDRIEAGDIEEGMRAAHVRDGVAVSKFLHSLDRNPPADELDASDDGAAVTARTRAARNRAAKSRAANTPSRHSASAPLAR